MTDDPSGPTDDDVADAPDDQTSWSEDDDLPETGEPTGS